MLKSLPGLDSDSNSNLAASWDYIVARYQVSVSSWKETVEHTNNIYDQVIKEM